MTEKPPKFDNLAPLEPAAEAEFTAAALLLKATALEGKNRPLYVSYLRTLAKGLIDNNGESDDD